MIQTNGQHIVMQDFNTLEIMVACHKWDNGHQI